MEIKNEKQTSLETNEDAQEKVSSNPADEKKNKTNTFIDLVKFALLAFIIVVPVRTFVASPFIVSGSSMSPTFETGHYLIVDKLSYRLGEPHRGDVVVFQYPNNPAKFFIKRIIGLPGETLISENGILKIDGVEIGEEPYVKFKKDDMINITLTADQYFVMGDNRSASSDSRVWGPLDKKFITGTPFIRLIPLTKINLHPGEFNNY